MILLAFCMSSCATLPPVLTYISYVKAGADGISYISSQKSTTDHILSLSKNQDCAMHRALWNEKVCKEDRVEEKAIADIAELKTSTLKENQQLETRMVLKQNQQLGARMVW